MICWTEDRHRLLRELEQEKNELQIMYHDNNITEEQRRNIAAEINRIEFLVRMGSSFERRSINGKDRRS